ncbi:hypothetical protein GCM10022393_42220 [Aquimarina addita]|uniref:Uncharacterized protein n=1 Tax=Aquimarina addita TaxID=870485 RepID=A0ABP6UZ10_9FLAO
MISGIGYSIIILLIIYTHNYSIQDFDNRYFDYIASIIIYFFISKYVFVELMKKNCFIKIENELNII